jgi:hypothetical protein
MPSTCLEHQAIGGHGGDSFHDAEEQVRTTEQSIVDHAIPFRTRRPEHDPRIGRLGPQSQGWHHVGAEIDRKHLDDGQGEGDAQQHER